VCPCAAAEAYSGGKSTGQAAASAQVQLLSMPRQRTLTLNLKVPEPWLVEPVVAVCVPPPHALSWLCTYPHPMYCRGRVHTPHPMPSTYRHRAGALASS